MKNIKKRIALILSVATIITCFTLPVSATQKNSEASAITKGTVVFENLDKDPVQSITCLDSNGIACIVSIEPELISKAETNTSKINGTSAAVYTTWRVEAHTLVNYADFSCTVAYNKVTSVSDYHITTIGFTYSNVELSNTTSYGMLKYTANGYNGLLNITNWVQATVTGSNNNLSVSYYL